jgi:23S rRNA (uracil1939-C5)-methyltransferase
MLDSPPRVLDLYCGSGNLSLRLPESVEVLGFDHNQAAIDAANALRPKAYRAGDEASFAKALRKEAWDAVILDPPRTGAKTITDVLCNCTARRIVYVSCDPATLARDVKVLTQAGWRLTRATAVDLFPQTCHIETVCLLERQ